MIKTALLSLLTLSLAAQAPETKKADPKAAAPQPEGVAGVPAGDKVLAKIGTQVIRQSDVDFALEGMAPQERTRVERAPGGRERYSASFVELMLLAAKARQMGLNKAPRYDQKLLFAESQLLANELMMKEGPELQKRLTLTDEQLKAYFTSHAKEFKGQDKFTARHIIIPTKAMRPGDKLFTDEEAKAQVEKVKAEFKKGRSWDELAKEFSSDPGSKDKGGLYENIAFGSFVPEFESAVRKQEPGKLGEAVKTEYGYHLIQVEKIVPAEGAEFDKVKEQVRQRATQAHSETVWKEFMEQLKKDVGAEIGEGVQIGAPATPAPRKPEAKKAEPRKAEPKKAEAAK